MKYLVMVQGSQADYAAMSGESSGGRPAWSRKDMQEMFAFRESINNDLAESGEMVDANPG
ncbi:YciI family protein, partial [Streptomyces sp. JAC25]